MNNSSAAVKALKIHRSVGVTVRTLPNRKLLSSGTYPGVRNTKSTPTAMPNAHTTAIAESSRTRKRRLIQSTPRLLPTANTAARATGLMPRK